jgi:hypothetical protein
MRFKASFAHSRLTQEVPEHSILILEPLHCTLVGLDIRLNSSDLAFL